MDLAYVDASRVVWQKRVINPNTIGTTKSHVSEPHISAQEGFTRSSEESLAATVERRNTGNFVAA